MMPRERERKTHLLHRLRRCGLDVGLKLAVKGAGREAADHRGHGVCREGVFARARREGERKGRMTSEKADSHVPRFTPLSSVDPSHRHTPPPTPLTMPACLSTRLTATPLACRCVRKREKGETQSACGRARNALVAPDAASAGPAPSRTQPSPHRARCYPSHIAGHQWAPLDGGLRPCARCARPLSLSQPQPLSHARVGSLFSLSPRAAARASRVAARAEASPKPVPPKVGVVVCEQEKRDERPETAEPRSCRGDTPRRARTLRRGLSQTTITLFLTLGRHPAARPAHRAPSQVRVRRERGGHQLAGGHGKREQREQSLPVFSRKARPNPPRSLSFPLFSISARLLRHPAGRGRHGQGYL